MKEYNCIDLKKMSYLDIISVECLVKRIWRFCRIVSCVK